MTGLMPENAVRDRLVAHPDRAAWLRARHDGIGASESAALFGLSPYHDRFSLWAKKIGHDDTADDEEVLEIEDPRAERMEWGHLLEGPIAAKFEQRSGARLWHHSDFCIARHERLPFMLATVDRFILEHPEYPAKEGVLEIKNTSNFRAWQDGPPLNHQCQAQHQLAVTGRDYAVLAVLMGGNSLRFWEIERNDQFIGELEAEVEAFWESVLTRTPPEVTGHKACLEAVKRLHPADNGTEVVLPDEAGIWWSKLMNAKAMESAAEAEKREAEARLREAIGDATFGLVPGGLRLSLKTTTRKGYTSVVEPCTYRTLREVKPEKTPTPTPKRKASR